MDLKYSKVRGASAEPVKVSLDQNIAENDDMYA